MNEAQLHRTVRALYQVGRDYPGVWDTYDGFRASRDELGGWPDHVFVPLAGAYAVVSGGGDGRVPIERAGDIARVGALAAWRPTQGIYRYAPALLEALLATPVDGALPVEVLRHLPEWCVYIELDPTKTKGVHGVWAHMEYDTNTRGEELRLLLDFEDAVLGVPLPLVGTLDDALQALSTSVRAEMVGQGLSDLVARAKVHGLVGIRPLVEPIVSVLLYLCTAAAEVRGARGEERRGRPKPRRDKHGRWRWPPADRLTVWETGTRLGAALDRAAQVQATRGDEGEGVGPAVRPHIRRAHWHAYWLGAHGSPDRRTELRWLPPIPVNLDGEAPDVATVHPVKGQP